MLRPLGRAAGLVVAALVTTLLVPTSAPAAAGAVPPWAPSDSSDVPALAVSTVVGGLDHPWDVAALPDGSLLVTERDRRRLLRVVDGTARPVAFPSESVWSTFEAGLMSLAVDPGFAGTRRFYTCQGGYDAAAPGGHDVRVVSWRLSEDGSTATQTRVLVRGIPATSGRHSGCRLRIAPDGALLVGTGDAAVGSNPRSLTSLGGKVLRVDRVTGGPAAGNPWRRAKNPAKRLVWTFGHRNVQGLAVRGDQVWSVEHGTQRDDEVNRLVRRGDYGFAAGADYNSGYPMTDQSLPGVQREARWSSGSPTLATSGASFVLGDRWRALHGALAVAALKGQQVVFFRFDLDDRLVASVAPAELQGWGRLRSVTQLPGGGDLLLTTDNGDGQDRVLRVRPLD